VKPNRVEVYEFNPNTVWAHCLLAKSQEWKTVKVYGSEEFRRLAWKFYQVLDIPCEGYEPSLKDKEKAESMKLNYQKKAVSKVGPQEDLHNKRKEAAAFIIMKSNRSCQSLSQSMSCRLTFPVVKFACIQIKLIFTIKAFASPVRI
jgi:hypothetical protein